MQKTQSFRVALKLIHLVKILVLSMAMSLPRIFMYTCMYLLEKAFQRIKFRIKAVFNIRHTNRIPYASVYAMTFGSRVGDGG